MNKRLPESEFDAPASPPRKRRYLADWLFKPWMKSPDDAPRNWQQDAHRAYVSQQPLRARALLYIVGVIVIALVVWAAVAEVDEVTRGQGKVIPSQQVQVIQSQDGGVVTEILVREGNIVEKGQLLVRLDQTRSASDLRETRVELEALMVKAARLRASLQAEPFEPLESWPRESVPEIVQQELELYKSDIEQLALDRQIAESQLLQRQEELAETRARSRQLGRSLELTRQEMSVTRPMVQSGAVSQVEILRLEREVNQLSGEYEQSQSAIKRLASAIDEAERKVSEVEVELPVSCARN